MPDTAPTPDATDNASPSEDRNGLAPSGDAPSADASADTPAGDPEALGDPGKKALEAMKRERAAFKKERDALAAQVKTFEDANKTEAQRLSDAASEHRTRAETAETSLARHNAALDAAPAHATITQIRAVAKRVHGSTPEELASDAEELFSLIAPPPSAEPPKPLVPGKPVEQLRGGGDPTQPPEETDPRKLADLIGR